MDAEVNLVLPLFLLSGTIHLSVLRAFFETIF